MNHIITIKRSKSKSIDAMFINNHLEFEMVAIGINFCTFIVI